MEPPIAQRSVRSLLSSERESLRGNSNCSLRVCLWGYSNVFSFQRGRLYKIKCKVLWERMFIMFSWLSNGISYWFIKSILTTVIEDAFIQSKEKISCVIEWAKCCRFYRQWSVSSVSQLYISYCSSRLWRRKKTWIAEYRQKRIRCLQLSVLPHLWWWIVDVMAVHLSLQSSRNGQVLLH